MASPFGHTLLGIALGRVNRRATGAAWVWWYAFAALAANLPDADFVPGLLVGDINRYHQMMSHSLTAVLVFAAGAWIASRATPAHRQAGRLALMSGALYGSHLVLDFFTRDRRAPFGQPLLWPFSRQAYISPWTPFGGIRHGVPGESMGVFLGNLASWHNLSVIALEAMTLLPLVGLSWWLTRERPDARGGPRGAGD